MNFNLAMFWMFIMLGVLNIITGLFGLSAGFSGMDVINFMVAALMFVLAAAHYKKFNKGAF